MSTTFIRSRRPLLVMLLGALFVGILFLAGLGPWPAGSSFAFAQGAPGSTNSEHRFRELEQRVKILELENETLDRRLHLEAERSGRLFEDLDRRVHVLEQHPAAPAEPAATQEPKRPAIDAYCSDPYIQLGPGAGRLKPGCDPTGNPCDAPWAVDARGIRTVLPACAQSLESNAGGCDSRYYVDPNGVKRFKPECL
jgi:hypothetical protein